MYLKETVCCLLRHFLAVLDYHRGYVRREVIAGMHTVSWVTQNCMLSDTRILEGERPSVAEIDRECV
jgi:hypothetical protein